MIPKFTQEEFQKAKPKELLALECKQCQCIFHRTKRIVRDFINPNSASINQLFLSFIFQQLPFIFNANIFFNSLLVSRISN